PNRAGKSLGPDKEFRLVVHGPHDATDFSKDSDTGAMPAEISSAFDPPQNRTLKFLGQTVRSATENFASVQRGNGLRDDDISLLMKMPKPVELRANLFRWATALSLEAEDIPANTSVDSKRRLPVMS